MIGFNARPIACSLRRLGAAVFVSDYWGDADLTACCDRWVSVLNPQPGQRQRSPLTAPTHMALAQNFLAEFGTDFDYVFLGSGFDDHPETVRTLETQLPIVGNDSYAFQRARNRSLVQSIADKFGLRYPISYVVRSSEEAIDAAENIGYPCIVRRLTSGGGGGIHLVQTETSLRSTLERLTHGSDIALLVQQYIEGLDCSATLIGTGGDAMLLSIQGQLIGMPSAGRNCDFVYCGNYWPCPKTTEMDDSLFVDLAVALQLRGYNGVDFVVDSEEQIWLMEINPRVTGTLEMLERSSDQNLMAHHIAACEAGVLPLQVRLRPCVKMIVYARRTGAVPDLSLYKNTVDRTPTGVVVKRGDPICTVIDVADQLFSAYTTVVGIAQSINNGVRQVDASM